MLDLDSLMVEEGVAHHASYTSLAASAGQDASCANASKINNRPGQVVR